MSHSPAMDDDVPEAVDAMTDSATFTVDVTEEADQVIAHVRGEIDLSTCERLRDAIEPHLGPRQHIILDLSEVSFMDSSCLGVLLRARTTLTSDGGSLILRNPSKAARRLLSALGTTDLFDAEIG